MVLPKSCMMPLAQQLPKLRRRLHHAATLGRAFHSQTSGSQGKHTCLVQRYWLFRTLACQRTAAHHLLCLQANLTSRLALTSASWPHTCSRSGTMRLMPSWAASPSAPKMGGRSGGAMACANLASHIGGRQQSAIAQTAGTAPTILAKQPAPATIWLTTTQRWQRSGTGGPTRKGHQRVWQQPAISK